MRRVARRPLPAIRFLDTVHLEFVHSRPRLNQTFNAAQAVGLGQGSKGLIVLCLGFVFQPAILERADFRLGLTRFLELVRQSQLGRSEHVRFQTLAKQLAFVPNACKIHTTWHVLHQARHFWK